MSAKPQPDDTRVELVKAKRSLRVGRCVACSCERFELKEHTDGYPHCACNHTQWGHLAPGGATILTLQGEN